MIKYTQTKTVVFNSKGGIVQNGNCFQTTFASILDLPINDVPNVETLFDIDNPFNMNSFWREVMSLFISSKGYNIKQIAKSEIPIDTHYLVEGNTIRNIRHICIYYNGELAHDTHPSREGLTELSDFYIITKA